MGTDSQIIPSGQNVQAATIDQRESAASSEKTGKGLGGKVAMLAKSLMMLSGPAALVGFVLGKEKISAIASVVFEKLSTASSHVAGTIVSNFSAFSFGVLGAGLLNVIDGYGGYKASSRSLTEVNEKLKTFSEDSGKHEAYAKLKQLHQSKRTRSLLQGFVGIAAATVGGLALAGVIANPYALLAVGTIAGTVLVFSQVHKWVNERHVQKIDKELKPQDTNQGDIPGPSDLARSSAT